MNREKKESKKEAPQKRVFKYLKGSDKKVVNKAQERAKPESKQEARDRKRAKKAKIYNCDMTDLLYTYEKLRYKECENRVELLQKEIDSLSRNIVSAAVSRTESRILYLVFYYGSEPQKLAVFDALKASLLDIAKEKYGRHLAVQILTQTSAYAQEFIQKSVLPVLPKLCGQIYSLEVITNITANSKKLEYQFLQCIFDDGKQAFNVLRTAGSKDLFGSVFVHKILRRYIKDIATKKIVSGSNAEPMSQDQLLQQIADLFEPENFLQLISSVDGVFSACQLFQYYTAKQKQKIMNEAKKQLEKILQDDISRHFITYTMLNTDDTRFVSEFLGVAMKGACGDFCQFVLLSGLETLRSGRFALNGALEKALFTEIADKNKKPLETRFAEVYCYFNEAISKLYQGDVERVRKLVTSKVENFIFLQLLDKSEVTKLMSEDLNGEPLFKHDVAHYALKQYLKRFGSPEVCAVFLERFETLDVGVFTRRGCNVLMMLENLDKEATHAFVKARLQQSAEQWVKGILNE